VSVGQTIIAEMETNSVVVAVVPGGLTETVSVGPETITVVGRTSVDPRILDRTVVPACETVVV
jgi:hypothetical protein